MKKGSLLRRILLICVLTVAVAVFCIALINWHVYRKAKDRIRSDFPEGSTYDCILVLGAGLRADGTPSDMLRDRLDCGIKLYKMGLSSVILLSGDCSGEDYDEVGAMEKYCLDEGIPAEAILRDNDGFSTSESIANLNQYDMYRVIVVTQSYHLYRALYIANAIGIEADGYSADVRAYRGQIFREIREVAARCKDFFSVIPLHITSLR